MLYFVIALLIIILVGAGALVFYMQQTMRKLADEVEQTRQAFEMEAKRYQKVSENELHALKTALWDSHRSLYLVLEASPGNFNNVSTEIGVNGVVYQFNKLTDGEEPRLGPRAI